MHSQDLNVNSPYYLPSISNCSLEFNKFPALSRTSSPFPGLFRPGKCHNKIPGLSRFSRTRTNPVNPGSHWWKASALPLHHAPAPSNHITLISLEITEAKTSNLCWNSFLIINCKKIALTPGTYFGCLADGLSELNQKHIHTSTFL